ncbi:MAG: hypothetical protein HKN74_14460 [Acidimicrobiia bacterium]|nr:hypothetical protein [Acidimicrobiia bacterium]NNF11477.1 hypothetical protein [Acidimicrobiia bacterium]
MRVAVQPIGEVGRRVARVLQAEPAVDEVVAWGVEEAGRLRVVERLEMADVAVTDSHKPRPLADACLEGATSLVTSLSWDDEPVREFAEAGLSLVVGANIETGLAAGLALQEAALMDEPLEVRLAWTVHGKPRRRGEPIPFPEPVGSRWAREVDPQGWDSPIPIRTFEAPVDGGWVAAMAQVSGALDDGIQRTIVGTADHGAYLAAIALAAAVVPAGQHAYPSGRSWAFASPSAYLDRALAAGLDVASYHERVAG